jgi:GT2 family glycosyltransferase
MHIDLSIIIVSYNTKELTENCIDSIINNTRVTSYEIIVIDNASTDGSVKMIDELSKKFSSPFPLIQLIKNKSNLGYARANNQGIKAAKGKGYLLLNSDTIILENSIDEAYEYLKEADIFTINLKNEDMTNQQAAGFGPNMFNIFCWAMFIDDLPFMNRIIKPYQISDLKYFNETHEVDWVMGAFFLMKKEVVAKTGFLDENIFMYGEEMEYCKRARNQGFSIMYFHTPSIIHLGMGSSETSEAAILGEYRALKYFFEKYYNIWRKGFLNTVIYASILLRIAIYSIINPNKAKMYEKAFKTV